MDDPNHDTFNSTPSMEITGQIMVVAIIILFVVVVFVLFLHLYAKWFWWRLEQPPATTSRRQRRRFVFAPGQDPAFTLRTGLDPAVLRSIPVVTFTPQEFKDGLECAVCLSEVVEGEKARLLPKCNHGFHVDCIDMWFQSHSTCPLCRNPVDLESPVVIEVQSSEENLAPGHSAESPNFPTNVLFWGNETQVSTGGVSLEEGTSSSSSSSESSPPCASSSSSTLTGSRRGEMLVIDIPLSMSEHLSSLSPAISPEGESKSPVTTRLRSLKRLLSREKRVSPSCTTSSSSTSFDIEQIRKG